MGKRAKRYYTVYLCKTDEVIAQGTAEECAKQMGFSQANSFFSSLVKHKNGKAHMPRHRKQRPRNGHGQAIVEHILNIFKGGKHKSC